MSRSLVVLLHGVGSSGSDLAPLGAAWRQALPETTFVAPDAPLPFGQGPGRQWFSVANITEANRPERVAAARAAFDRTLAEIIAAHGLTGHLDRVALVGFSQGAIMALDAVASGRWPVAAVVALAGRLATPPPLTPAKGTRALLIHGAADPVIAAAESSRAGAILRDHSVAAVVHILAGVGHTISREGASLAETFLTETFNRPGVVAQA